MSLSLTATQFATFIGLTFSSRPWIVWLGITVMWLIVPALLATWTRSHWIQLSSAQSIHLDESRHAKKPVESPAKWYQVFFAFLVWSFCSYSFSLSIIIVLLTFPEIRALPPEVRSFYSDIRTLCVAFLSLSLANMFVEILIRDSSRKNWKDVSVWMGLGIVLLLVSAGPQFIFKRLGVGYIRCESGSVLVEKPAADKIWRVLPDAIDRDEPMPALIQKYDVEIVSKIGKEALLKFSLGRNERWNEKIFVPTESIAGYRQVP